MKLPQETIAECKRLLKIFETQDQGVTVISGKEKQINLKTMPESGQTLVLKITGSKAKFVLINEKDADVLPMERPNGNPSR